MFKKFLSNLSKRIFGPPARPEIVVSWRLPERETDLAHEALSHDIHQTEQNPPIDISGRIRRPNPLILHNLGSRAAYNIQLPALKGRGGTLLFPEFPTQLGPGRKVRIHGLYRRDLGPDSLFAETIENFFLHEAFLLPVGNWVAESHIVRAFTLSYEDVDRQQYQTLFSLRYQPTSRQGTVVLCAIEE